MRLSRFVAVVAVPWLVSTAALAHDRSNFDAFYSSTPLRALPVTIATAPLTVRAPAGALVSSLDARRSVPALLWAPSPQPNSGVSSATTPAQAARLHLARYAGLYGLSQAALDAAQVVQVHDTGRGGIIVVLRQRIGGVEVFHNDAKLLMNRNRELVAIGGNLHPGAARQNGTGFLLGEAAALARAFHDLYGTALPTSAFRDTRHGQGGYRAFALATGPATLGYRLGSPARVKRVWFPMPDRLVPAYQVVLMSTRLSDSSSDAYEYVIAADDRRLLYRSNLTHSDAFEYRVWADSDGEHRPSDGPVLDYSPHPGGAPDGSYPGFGDTSLVSVDGLNQSGDPWLPAGATETRGNNVDAYTDDDAPDGFSAKDTRASVTQPGRFDRVFDPNAGPQSSLDQKMASVTQLFYVTNWLHDYWYDSGFDEAAGNAQKDNYGRGGLAGDALHAEAQDGAPGQRNNANMSVLPDGDSPRMQMFIWDGLSTGTLSVQPLGASFPFGVAAFSPPEFETSGPLALANDGSTPVTDACQPLTQDLTGKIVVIDRGTCTFKSKAVAAVNAGAIGVIVVDNQSGTTPPPMGDADPPGALTIPVASMTLANGNQLKAAMQAGPATVSMSRKASPDRDGTLDNTIVAHEWGHYAHLRQVACGSPACFAESEGWGDFFALHMVVREGDDLDGAFALSQYASVALPDDPAYFGIRRYPYSVDFAKNALTFKHIMSGQELPPGVPVAVNTAERADNSESHAAGEIWASMLFEAYVALLKRAQGVNPPYTFSDAQRRMADYVEAGLKLAPRDPTFTEQRDAILAAAAATDLEDLAVLAAAFARRGAGTCAVSPPRDSSDLTGVVEAFTVEPNLAITSLVLDDSVSPCDDNGHLDAGETGRLTIEVVNRGTAPLVGAGATVSATLPGVLFPDGTKIEFGTVAPFTSAKGSIEVSLAPTVTRMAVLDLAVKLDNAGSCATEDSLHTAPLVNYDEVADASATDTVEPATTAWATKGANAKDIWERTEPSPGNHVWSAVDFPSPSDTSLQSPPLQVSDSAPFVLTFAHRHLFEESSGVTWDGSVVELSTDDGKSWADISTYADPGYGGQIGDPTGQANNVLEGRQGYVGKSSAWPALQTVTIDLGTALAGQTVRVRFRIGTDDAAGDFGWELDNISFAGITNTPFPAVTDKQSSCADALAAQAGPDQTVWGGSLVTLDGSESTDQGGGALSFAWTQVAGAPVTLSSDGGATATFIAPSVSMPETLSFQLAVSSTRGFATDSVSVAILVGSEPVDGGADSEPVDSGMAGPEAGLSADPASDRLYPGGGCSCTLGSSGPRAPATASLIGLAALALLRRRFRSLLA